MPSPIIHIGDDLLTKWDLQGHVTTKNEKATDVNVTLCRRNDQVEHMWEQVEGLKTTEKCVVRDTKHGHSRRCECLTITITRELCLLSRNTGNLLLRCKCHTCSTVCWTLKLLRGHRKRTAGGKWVAAQKPHNSTWQGKPACWG